MNMYDAIIIGAGPAGYEIASILGNANQNVCLIEKQTVGGTCLNEGCVPAKNYLETSSYIKKQEYFESCGVNFNSTSFDINSLQNKTNKLITDLRGGILAKLKKANVKIIYSNAKFLDSTSVIINDNETIQAKNIIIASGSSHRNHPLLSLHSDKIISSKEVFTLKEIPKSLLIIGGGAIGCEFASFYNALGCDVQIAEFTSSLVPIEDDDISKTLKRELEKKGIKVYLNANVTQYEVNDNDVSLTLDLGVKSINLTYEKILVSIGRIPNTKSLDLQNANIKNDNGFIEVNDNLQTLNNDNIYAIGDILKSPALAHVAYYEAKKVAAHILGNTSLSSHYIFPSVTFCTPQIASIGQGEKKLKEKNIEYKVKKLFFKANAKAKIKGDDSGFIKVIYDDISKEILGASIIGNDATELIHQFLIIINSKVTLNDLEKMIFAHPTLSESILDLLH